MDITIKKGSDKYANDCVEAFFCSDLGTVYYPKKETCKKAIEERLEQGTLYVALIGNDFAGFFWYLPDGAFTVFPAYTLSA